MPKKTERRKGLVSEKGAFELLVKEAVDSLPEEIKKNLENVAIIIEEDIPAKKRSRGNYELLGLYHGVPKKERGFWYGNTLPDRIVIFKRPLERISSDGEELRENVRRTVFHEVGHYFGLNEDELRSLEEEIS